MANGRVGIFVTTRYEGLDADGIECVEFVDAVKQGLTGLEKYNVIEQKDRTLDHYQVFLAFARMNDYEGEPTVLSAVLGFHDGNLDADFFLEHWPSYFSSRDDLQERAGLFVGVLEEAIARRMEQGFL